MGIYFVCESTVYTLLMHTVTKKFYTYRMKLNKVIIKTAVAKHMVVTKLHGPERKKAIQANAKEHTQYVELFYKRDFRNVDVLISTKKCCHSEKLLLISFCFRLNLAAQLSSM